MTTRNSVRRPGASSAGFTLLEVLAAVLILGIWFTVLAGVAIQGLRAEGEAQRRLRAEMIADARMTDLEGAAQLGALPPIGEDQSAEDEFQIHTRVAALDLPAVAAAAATGGVPPAGGAAGAGGAAASAGAATGQGAGNVSPAGGGGAATPPGQATGRRGAAAGGLASLAARAHAGSTPGASSTPGAAAGATAGAAGASGAAAAPPNGSFFAPTPGGGPPPLRQLQVEVDWQEGAVQHSVLRTGFALDTQAAAPLLQALDQVAQQAAAATASEPETPPAGASDQETESQTPGGGE